MRDVVVRRTSSHSTLVSLLLASSALVGVAPAYADTNGTQVETVVVTAEKRTENLQAVPLSIQVLGNDKLQQLHVSSLDDYVKYLPSVTYQSAGPGLEQVYMRGIASGENGNHSGPLPSVGTYLDEQPITTIGGTLDIHAYDIARVEALSGPQGTLYGASSEAGTIRIITNQPDPSGFSAAFDVEGNTVAHGGVGYVAEGYANIPLGDNVAIRLVAWDKKDAGYIDNVAGTDAAAGILDGVRTYPTASATNEGPPTFGGPITVDSAPFQRSDYNFVDTIGGRAALRIELDNNWTITPTLMGQAATSKGFFAFDPNVGDLQVVHFGPEFQSDKWYQAALTIEGKIGNFDLTYSGAFMDRTIKAQSDYSDYSYFYDVVYNSVAYNDAGNVIDPSQKILGRDHFTKFSHELRIASPSDDRLRFVAGAFTQRQFHRIEQRYVITDLASSSSVDGWPNTIWLTEQDRVDRDYALFAEVSYDLLPNLTLTGGVRGYIANNSLQGFFGYKSYEGSKCFAPASVDHGPCTDLKAHDYEDGYTHKLNATYKFDDSRMIYATWSTGFRPGGANRTTGLGPYSADHLTNYEVGWKTSWLDDSVIFDGALFWEEWDGIQFTTIPPGSGGLTQIFNAGKARVLGVEANGTWRPTDGLTLSAAATYLDAELTQNFCHNGFVTGTTDQCNPSSSGPETLTAKGFQLPVSPHLKGNAIARYQWSMGDYTPHVQAAVVYTGSAWSALLADDRNVLGKMPAYTTADFSLGVDYRDWTAEVAIQNAFDERGQNTRFTGCATGTCSAEVYYAPIRPRLISIKLGEKF